MARKNATPASVAAPVAPVAAPVAPVAAPVAPVAAPMVITQAMIVLAWKGLQAICYGLVTGSPWHEYTPIGKDKKPEPKVVLEGIADGNRIAKVCKVTKQTDKILFCHAMNLIIQKPDDFHCPEIDQPAMAGSKIRWFDLLVHDGKLEHRYPDLNADGSVKLDDNGKPIMLKRAINLIHYRPTFEWSGTDKNGNTVYGLGRDWPTLLSRWIECQQDEFATAEKYGFEKWGEYKFSPINVLEQIKNAIVNHLDVPPPVERGRGKRAKTLQLVVPKGMIENEIAAMIAAEAARK